MRDYLAMTPQQILNEPDAPESLKIRARIQLENEAAAEAAADRQETDG